MRTPLGRAALLLVALAVLHDLDHLRQGRDEPAQIVALAITGWIATAVLLFLIARRHRYAAPFAAALGLSQAAGFVAVHVLPHWSAFSDSYGDAGVDALSWALAILPILAALNLVREAVRELRTPALSSA
jgi:hypothetical protein